MSIKCYEFFECRRKPECHFYNEKDDRNCWEVEVTATPFVSLGNRALKPEEKIIICEKCLYYERMHRGGD